MSSTAENGRFARELIRRDLLASTWCDSAPAFSEYLEESEYTRGEVLRAWGSYGNLVDASPLNPVNTFEDETILEDVARVHQDGEGYITFTEYKDRGGVHSQSSFRRRWGSWVDAQVEAGVDVADAPAQAYQGREDQIEMDNIPSEPEVLEAAENCGSVKEMTAEDWLDVTYKRAVWLLGHYGIGIGVSGDRR